jgi:hypothetical protein
MVLTEEQKKLILGFLRASTNKSKLVKEININEQH